MPLASQMVYTETPRLQVNFICTVNGGHGTSVEIFWNGPAGVTLPDTASTRQIDNGVFTSYLTLINVTASFTGTYSCTARYSIFCNGTVTSSTNLLVIGRPTIISQTVSPLVADSGSNVSFYFEFSSLPSNTSVCCSGPGGADINTTGIILRRLDNNAQSLIRTEINITSINHTHGGMYWCTANNSAGENTSTLLFLVRPVVEPSQVLAKNGDNVTLMCVSQSLPEPSYSWQIINGNDGFTIFPDTINLGSGSGGSMMTASPFFDFKPVNYRDEGMYRCVVNFGGMLEVESEGIVLTGKIKLFNFVIEL